MKPSQSIPVLYHELADWFPLLTPPEEYAEEAQFYRQTLQSSCTIQPHTLLELGSGGGNNASHLKRHFRMTLVDLSPEMLAVSRKLNSECEHLQGDMRTVRLRRQFDAVFIHDAIDYMLTEVDLSQAVETAYVHCKPGGAALFAPDHTRETFQPSTLHGGNDRGERSLRYLEWTWDPDPDDSTYITDMAYLLRAGDQSVRCVQDRHICGLFAQADWLRLLQRAGFEGSMLPFEHGELEFGSSVIFLGCKPEMAD